LSVKEITVIDNAKSKENKEKETYDARRVCDVDLRSGGDGPDAGKSGRKNDALRTTLHTKPNKLKCLFLIKRMHRYSKKKRFTRKNRRVSKETRRQRGGFEALASLGPLAMNYAVSKLETNAKNYLQSYIQDPVKAEEVTQTEVSKKNVSKKKKKESKQANVEAYEFMLDKKNWDIFGDGNEASRLKLLKIMKSSLSWSDIKESVQPFLKDSTNTLMSTFNYVAKTPKSELIAETLVANFDDAKDDFQVSKGMSFNLFEKHVKEGTDDRNLSKCIYIGNISENSPKHEIASFCLPEVNDDEAESCTQLLCFNLKDLKQHVQEQKKKGKQVLTFQFDEIIKKVPSARTTLNEYMSPIWVQMIETYPTQETTDVFVLGLISLCYNFARNNVPILSKVLQYTEGVGSKIASKTPEFLKRWIGKMVKRGKVTLLYFAHNPAIVNACMAASKFFRLAACVYFSTALMKEGKREYEMTRIAVKLFEMAVPLARSNPLFALPYVWLKHAFSMKRVLGATLTPPFFLLGGFWQMCLEIPTMADSSTTMVTGISSLVLMLPFRAITGNNGNELRLNALNPLAAAKGALSTTVFNWTGFNIKDEGFEMARNLESIQKTFVNRNGVRVTTNESFLQEHVHDCITLVGLQLIPSWLIDYMIAGVAGFFFGPPVAKGYLTVMELYKKVDPGGHNILLMMYKLATVSGTGSMVYNVYPLKEIRLIWAAMHEGIKWFTEVGGCMLKQIQQRYFVQGSLFYRKFKDDELCCMADEVKAVHSQIEADRALKSKAEMEEERNNKINENANLGEQKGLIKKEIDSLKNNLKKVEKGTPEYDKIQHEIDEKELYKEKLEEDIQKNQDVIKEINKQEQDDNSFEGKFRSLKIKLSGNISDYSLYINYANSQERKSIIPLITTDKKQTYHDFFEQIIMQLTKDYVEKTRRIVDHLVQTKVNINNKQHENAMVELQTAVSLLMNSSITSILKSANSLKKELIGSKSLLFKEQQESVMSICPTFFDLKTPEYATIYSLGLFGYCFASELKSDSLINQLYKFSAWSGCRSVKLEYLQINEKAYKKVVNSVI
jgi:hypothetical protein